MSRVTFALDACEALCKDLINGVIQRHGTVKVGGLPPDVRESMRRYRFTLRAIEAAREEIQGRVSHH